MIPLILSLLLGAQLQAQTTTTSSPALKATIRLQIAKVAAPDASPDTALGNLGPIVATLLTPDGPVDIDYVVAGESMRGDVQGRLGMFTRGTIILQRVGEDSITVMNPGNHTWFELPATATLGSTMSAPDVQMEPTGERATIAGQRAERFKFAETIRIPVPEGANLPSEFPRQIDLAGDLWSTDAFSGHDYAAIFRTLQAAGAIPGMEALTAGGRFPLRIAVRSSMMPGYEIRSEVVSIGPARPSASFFDVPRDYQQVQFPAGRSRN
jgi:hypothetical protein